MPLGAYARRKLEPSTRPQTSIKWLGFIGASRDHDCALVTTEALRDERLDLSVRAAALPALVDCQGKPALGTVSAMLDSPTPALRVGAVHALALLPRVPEVVPLLERRLTDTDVEVLCATARAAGPTHEKRLLAPLIRLLNHAEPAVRLEAADAIAGMEAEPSVQPLGRCLEKDSDPKVRAACARALGALGVVPAPCPRSSTRRSLTKTRM